MNPQQDAAAHVEQPQKITKVAYVLIYTFLACIASSVVSTACYAIAAQAYAFSDVEIFLLGLVWGIACTPSPLISHWLLQKFPKQLTPRLLMIVCNGALAASCMLPAIASAAATPPSGGWAMWLMVALYAHLINYTWPINESYMSAGRPAPLTRFLSIYSVTWSLASCVAFIALSTLIAAYPVAVLVTLGVVHAGLAVYLHFFYTTHPAAHGHGSAESPPEKSKEMAPAHDGPSSSPTEALPILRSAAAGTTDLGVASSPSSSPSVAIAETAAPAAPAKAEVSLISYQMLTVFRILLPMSQVVLSTLIPYFTVVETAIGLSPDVQSYMNIVWMGARFCIFVAMTAWRGWRDRWATPIVSPIAMFIGFGMVALDPVMFPAASPDETNRAGVVVLLLALVLVGAGWAIIYNAGLFYSMEVGSSDVKAGAFFEFFLALGNACGPLLGLVPRVLSDLTGVMGADLADPLTLVFGAITIAIFVFVAFWKAFRLAKAGSVPAH